MKAGRAKPGLCGMELQAAAWGVVPREHEFVNETTLTAELLPVADSASEFRLRVMRNMVAEEEFTLSELAVVQGLVAKLCANYRAATEARRQEETQSRRDAEEEKYE